MQTQPGTILIADDNENNRDLLSSRLQRQGHTVAVAIDGRHTIALLQEQSFDLLLLDIMMPEMNGYQVLAHLKSDDTLRHIPIIVVSALNDLDSVVRCIELGADDYLFKPFNPTLLKARVNACLEKKRLRDSEQTHLAVVQAANLAKTEFISFVAHELKTPMTAILGYTDMLGEGYAGVLNETQIEFLNIIRSNTIMLKALVSDLSDISRIETGHLLLSPTTVSLTQIVDTAVQAMRGQIEANAHVLTLDVPQTLPLVWADTIRLSQVLANLVSNACKYTPSGGHITIRAEYVPSEPEADHTSGMLHLSVCDTGIGMRPDDQDKLFQKFFRANDEHARVLPGTGLGLHITKNLVELQGGRIWFESVFRSGTTFHFTVPVATPTQCAASAYYSKPI